MNNDDEKRAALMKKYSKANESQSDLAMENITKMQSDILAKIKDISASAEAQ